MAFNHTPIELNGYIASYLDDHDLCNFALVCQSTNAAVNHPSSSVWRTQFAKTFDVPPNYSNDRLKVIYQFRKSILRNGAQFRDGRSRKEKGCMHVLRELILQSFSQEKGRLTSNNLLALQKFANDHDILRNVLAPKYSTKTEPLLFVLQILMAHLQLDLEVRSPTFGFPNSQRAVYATALKEPIFKGANKTEVNVEFVAHTVNFFKYHLTRREEQTLYDDYKNLPRHDRIRSWDRQLQHGAQKLGRSWKGIYSYVELEDLAILRDANGDDEIIMDNFSDEDELGVFQTMDLEFLDEPQSWPKLFERHLHSRTHPSATYFANTAATSTTTENTRPRTRAQHRSNPATASTSSTPSTSEEAVKVDPKPLSFQFIGSGVDAEPFLASGWLNPLPAQQGIPGWMRWTMMKFFVPENAASGMGADAPFAMGNVAAAAVNAAADGSTLWAYEGVVLPGGKIVVGRWWGPREEGVPEDHVYSGPFMFWCVDEADAEA